MISSPTEIGLSSGLSYNDHAQCAGTKTAQSTLTGTNVSQMTVIAQTASTQLNMS